MTVLFADLSGYTSVAERLDHETVKMLIERCLNRFAEEVERFGGRVDKFIGDNVMAVFGAPVAHEDDPERAVRAAFGMQAAMAELNGDIVGPVRLRPRAARRGQHRRGARRPRRRLLHGARRRRQRGRPAAIGGAGRAARWWASAPSG